MRKVSGEIEMMAWRVVWFGFEPSSKQVNEPWAGFVLLKRWRARDWEEPWKGKVIGCVRLTW